MTFVNDNNEILDVEGDLVLTKQAVSFFKFTINGDYSVNFTVPKNSETCNVLGYYGPQMNQQVAFTKQSFNAIDSQGNYLTRGSIVIQDDDGVSLNCFFVSGNSNWIQLLNGLITELDLSSYVTQINPLLGSGIYTAKTSGIVFPWVDWAYNYDNGYNIKYMFGWDGLVRGDNTVGEDGNVENSFMDLYPCFHLSSLVTEIFQQNNLKIGGTVLDDPLYKKMIIPPVNGQMKRVPFKDVICTGSSQVIAVNPTKYNTYTTVRDNDNQFSNGTFTPKRSQILYLKVYVSALSTATANITIYVNGVIAVGAITFSVSTGYTFKIDVAKGSTVEVYVQTVCTISLNLTVSTPPILTVGDYVDPSNFLPKLSCLDIVKFLVTYFGCSVYYNEFAKKLTVNIIDRIKPETALDCSDYYLNHRSEYTVSQAQNNYLRLGTVSDQETNIKNYNSSHLVGFGEGNITTGNTLKTKNDLVKIPFAPCDFDININGTWEATVPLINLTDSGAGIPYTAITDLGLAGTVTNFIRFTLAVQLNLHEVIRIVDNNGTNLGYFQTEAVTATTFDIASPFVSNHIGFIYRQTIVYQDITPRILINKTATSFSDFSSSLGALKPWNKTGYIMITDNASNKGVDLRTTIDYAFFTKNRTTEPIDAFHSNLAIDNPQIADFTDSTIKELYFNNITSFLQNPNIRIMMLLPKAVFQSFEFDRFIYIKSAQLTGYFFVESIVNYIDGKTPVEVNVYML